MTGIWKKILALIPGIAASAAAVPAMASDADDDKAWQAAYSAREKYYQASFGEFPEDILKIPELFGIWPGGGLFVIPAEKLGKGIWAYTSFGLSNVGMPTNASAVADVKKDHLGRVIESNSALTRKTPASAAAGAAGYGYELVLLARENAEWPLWVLQWATQAEIRNDVGLLKRVEKYNGLTVADIKVGEGENDVVNLLFAKAQAPLPTGVVLPNGRMDIIVVTVITTDEMNWSMENGRDALLAKLIASGAGQISDRARKSVL